MRKAQVSIFLIIGLVLLIVVGVFLFSRLNDADIQFARELDSVSSMAEISIDLGAYMRNCVSSALEEGMLESGLDPEDVPQYEQYVTDYVDVCFSDLFTRLEDQNYAIQAGTIDTNIEITEESVLVEVRYPITLERSEQVTTFEEFSERFERTVWVPIPGGVTDTDTSVQSNDGRAQLDIPPGVEVTDADGNPVEDIALRVEDAHFDGLSNGVVIGNLVVEGMPDGVQFSEPVTLTVEFDPDDLPPDVEPEELSVSWWDEEFQIWRAVPTRMEGNRLIAEIEHFTEIAGTHCRTVSVQRPTRNVFMTRYQPSTEEYWISQDGKVVPRSSAYSRDFFTDNIDAYTYGFFEGGSFTKCEDDAEYTCDDGHFCLDVEPFFTQPCDNSVDAPEIGSSLCQGLKEGNACRYQEEKVCVIDSSYPPEYGNICECVNIGTREKAFGVKDARCLGGISENPELECITFQPQGDSCLDAYWAQTVVPTADQGDVCTIEEGADGVLYTEELVDGRMRVCVSRVHYHNNNEDASGRCGIAFGVVGSPLEGFNPV